MTINQLYPHAMLMARVSKFAAISLALSLVLIGIPAFSASIAGTKCTKTGTTKTVSNMKYTCVKQGSKLVWNKGIAIKLSDSDKPKPTVLPSPTPLPTNSAPTPQETYQPESTPTTVAKPAEFKYVDPCQADPHAPEEWVAVQNWAITNLMCARPYRYMPGPNPTQTPTSELSNNSSLSIDSCKLDDSATRPWGWQRFGNPYRYYRPTVSAITQVIPVQFSDLKAESNPNSDYGKYLKFYSDFLVNSSDVLIKPVFRVPDHYFQIGYSFTKYNLNDGHKEDVQFIRDLETAIKSEIHLNGVDQVLLLLPPSAKYKDFDAKIPFGNLSGTSFDGLSMYLQGPMDLGQSANGRWTVDPWITAHEMFGHLMGLDDHLGAGLFNRNATMPSDLRDLGTGNWGMMSGVNGDFLVWDKWTVGWVADSQIKCISSSSDSKILISPNTTKSNLTKAVVIPLTTSRGIVIESQRSTGYNYKYPTSTNGALVYIVEMKEMAKGAGTPWGYGEYVQRPLNRPNLINQNGFALGDAALKQGESITVEGIKISVIEAGDFGDVVKVEKV